MQRLIILLFVSLFCGCCYLKVDTTPAGADVAVNDVHVGKSPVEAKIWFWQTFSPKKITAVKEGCRPGEAELGFWEVFFWIWGTTKERKIELAALPGKEPTVAPEESAGTQVKPPASKEVLKPKPE